MSAALAVTVFLTRNNNHEQNKRIGEQWFPFKSVAFTKDSIKSNV